MNVIDISDISLAESGVTLQHNLFSQIRVRILNGRWISGAKLPSTRTMAHQLKVSRNTVIQTYEQLVAEGYLVSKPHSGFFVSLTLPDQYLNAPETKNTPALGTDNTPSNGLFAPGVAELALFPTAQWNRLLQRHGSRVSLLGNQDLQGYLPLREALHRYLTSSRSVVCHPNRIIITSGAQQSIAIALLAIKRLGNNGKWLVEFPGYRQVVKVLETFDMDYDFVNVTAEKGLETAQILNQKALGVYLTPSNQYPMGSSIQTEQRLQLINWAQENQSWIIEDDYDSEFQFDSRPLRSMQGLAAESGNTKRMVYIGSMSKVMFNALRIGYMVVPKDLVDVCLDIKDALSGDTPSHTQAALAEFIDEGMLVRHIRKMRRRYEQKYRIIQQCIREHFGNEWQIVSQGAGLHITVQWQSEVDEQQFSDLAQSHAIVVRPMTYYEPIGHERRCGSVVLGYGNAPLESIPESVAKLAALYFELINNG
ncbi:HTH-type transcriptional regulatory protein GabR [Vibrio thalassae]|uniref:HTH-type transcriptional regulatory protein GabR n=1 Tax=Vibrio thalassae TaxID=1243014 RepID=A0A240ENF3_9VIBR|nr:PLP-dependent aminotransferase family protein [Vibrio thalassae]SNX50031.1 HTH-type transcriptional regulatory protein GabR [Vibrio thalassae]